MIVAVVEVGVGVERVFLGHTDGEEEGEREDDDAKDEVVVESLLRMIAIQKASAASASRPN
jgi:hypothetical protein